MLVIVMLSNVAESPDPGSTTEAGMLKVAVDKYSTPVVPSGKAVGQSTGKPSATHV